MHDISAYASRMVLIAGVLALAAMPSGRLMAASQTIGTPPPVAERMDRVRAQIFASADQAKAAIPELKRILAIDANLAEAHLLLGVAYRGSGTGIMVGEAKAELQQALDLEPGLIAARLMLAQVYLDLGR